ncbi:MAG: hypothetical protein ACOCQG_04560 [Candidatus Nanoarchaeia archaeon]
MEKGKLPNVKKEGGVYKISLSPYIYPLDVVYSASYVLLEKAYITIEGDPKKEIIAHLKPKNKDENLGEEFCNQLINYLEYKQNFEKNANIRQMIMQRALITNDPSLLEDIFEDEVEDEDIDDPDGIAVPWEEKYGKEENE